MSFLWMFDGHSAFLFAHSLLYPLSLSRLCVCKILLSCWSSGSHQCTTRQPDNACEYTTPVCQSMWIYVRELSHTEKWVTPHQITFLQVKLYFINPTEETRPLHMTYLNLLQSNGHQLQLWGHYFGRRCRRGRACVCSSRYKLMSRVFQ